ncbi:hypothetical protein [Streptomyces spiralis]|uniref:hypothetical protein n=1 Tax=Streptomyces spiralis TaxID=66376 RepID=UPI0033DD7B54
MNTTISWATREELPRKGLSPATARGLLATSPVGDAVVPFSGADLSAALDLTRATLAAAGLSDDDRVVVSLNSDGDLGGALIAQAAADVAQAAAATGPRGRMRLLQTLQALRGNVLVATPTGAADFLARLHMEFLVDPLDLELRLILLTGEITDRRTLRHLAAEFDARVVELYTDPVTGLPIAHRDTSDEHAPLQPVRPGILHCAPLDEDRILEASSPAGHAELVVTHDWHSALAGIAVRTGHVAAINDEAAPIPAPRHTVGDHVLVRGRWIHLTRLEQALRGIDGISAWRLEVDRKGTLDAATLRVTFNRSSLVKNGMWKGRIAQSIVALTPVHVDVDINETVDETPRPPEVVDDRGHHLGRDRKASL